MDHPSPLPELLTGARHERIDGVIRKFSIGTDIQRMLNFAVPKHLQDLKICLIEFDEAFLEKWGKVRMLIYVKLGKNTQIWKQVIDQTVIEYDIQFNPNELPDHNRKFSDRQAGPSAGNNGPRQAETRHS